MSRKFGEIIEGGDLRAAYRQYHSRLLTRALLIANGLAIFGVPAGLLLDHSFYPQKFWQFFSIRMAVVFILLIIIGILFLEKKACHSVRVKVLGILSALCINFAFCLMIFLTDGARSPYYAGLNLIIICWAVVLPWASLETAITCFLSLVGYVLACVMNPMFGEPSASPIFLFNTFFVLITTLVAIGTSFFLSRARFEEFNLRHQLDIQNRELQDLDRLKTQFFSNISHELRTPLTLILGPVETLLSRGGDSLDARVHEGLILVHRNALRLLKLINDLLDLMRLEQGAEILRKRNLSLGSFLRGIVDSVRHLGLSKNLKIRVEPGNESDEVLVDPARMEKVVLNLLTNAIKYTPASGSVTVRWRCSPDEVCIEVADTGVGIPAADLPKIFDRFHQVRGNASNRVQGVGIGLALAKDLVTEHGGRIDVQSELGKGSVFRVVLPRISEQQEVEEATGESFAEEPFEKAFRSADRSWRNPVGDEVLPVVGVGEEVVLVADDEGDMLQYVVSLLSQDHRVVQTRDGSQVCDLVREHRPEVVLLDWMMPGKDGLSLCRELRAGPDWADLKIMLLTARIDEESKIEALRAGADDFLTKPFSTAEVRTRVANLFRSAHLQKELRARNLELTGTLEKLQRTETLLIQSEKMNALGSLSAGLLHEINNPLNYTMTAISFAKQFESSLGPEVREILADIDEGMHRIRDVITHLKDFAYPEKPGTESLFSLREVFQSARKILARELDGVVVDVEIPETLLVRGQKTQITHVFMNLLGNAGKAVADLPPGAPREICVKAAVLGDEVSITVSDTGGGIPEPVLNRIFEPFFTTREVGAGMGMGLSICHTILNAHHGSIRAGNRPGGGAVFTVTLPFTAEDKQNP